MFACFLGFSRFNQIKSFVLPIVFMKKVIKTGNEASSLNIFAKFYLSRFG